jgi:hypothetical protein
LTTPTVTGVADGCWAYDGKATPHKRRTGQTAMRISISTIFQDVTRDAAPLENESVRRRRRT